MFRSSTTISVLLLASVASAQVTERVSVSSAGQELVAASEFPVISGDGRFVAFRSADASLVQGDTNGRIDIFVRDLLTGTNERISVSSAGVQGNGNCGGCSISPDARWVVFDSQSTNLSTLPLVGAVDRVFVRDRLNGTTVLASLDSAGTFPPNFASNSAQISADGRFVAFVTPASLVPEDTNTPVRDVYVRDLLTQTTELISVTTSGTTGQREAIAPALTPDGRFVAFADSSNDVVPGDTNPESDIFVRDRISGNTELVSVGSGGVHAIISCQNPHITPDGRFVLFSTQAANFDPQDTNATFDAYLRDRWLGTTERVSRTVLGGAPDGASTGFALSDDARFVVYTSSASNIVPGDTNANVDVFRQDRLLHTVTRLSTSTYLVQGNGRSADPSCSADGRRVVFDSVASTLVLNDQNASSDVFLHTPRLESGTAFCFGDGAVNGGPDCPCGNNAPQLAERGCVNTTGRGAVLRALGTASISEDTLALVAVDVPASTSCVFVQADTAAGGGLGEPVWFDGLRCLDAGIVRLRSRSASNGTCSLGFPLEYASFLGGVSAPGIRCYQIVYRNYGGPCDLLANTTNGVELTWTP